MAFDFPSSPSEGQIFNAPSGPTYVFNAPVWKAVGQGQIAIISDAAPANPANGTLWLESDTGILFIFWNDGNSAQWVQCGGQGGVGEAPNDGGEYVRVNGVWRLIRQSFNLATLTQLDIPVPAWGPSKARLTARIWAGAAASMSMRWSLDGTTFPASASDYSIAGYVWRSGIAAPGIAMVPLASADACALAGSLNHTNIPNSAVANFSITRASANDYLSFDARSHSYNTTAGVLYEIDFYNGYAQGAFLANANPIKAIRWFGSGAGIPARAGNLTMEWLQ